MAEIIKIENAALETFETGSQVSISLPIILVTVSDMNFSTWGQFYQFTAEVTENLGGAISCLTVFYNRYANPGSVNPTLNGMTPGTKSYGSTNGFQFSRFVGTYSNDVNQVGLGTNGIGSILYKGNEVWHCNIFGGSAPENFPIKMSPIVLFVDEDDKIFYGWNGTPDVISYWSGGWGGLGIQDDCLPYNEIPREIHQWYKSHADTDTFPTLTAEDAITDDIGNRVPVGGKDPYGKGGYAGRHSGGTGNYDYSGAPQPFGNPAAFKDGLDTGFYTLYAPSSTELQSLATYLWSTNFDLNLFKRLFNNPMDLFLVLGVLPVTIPKGNTKQVGIGLIQTGIYMTTASTRVVPVDMGTIHVTGETDSYLDYAPYTRCDLILPFIGVVPLDIDAIMEKYVHVQYNVDVLTGACVAGINAGYNTSEMHCIGTYAGNCMRSIPLTGADYTNMLSGLIQTAGAIAAGAAAGGGAGAVAGGLSAASSAVVNEGKPMIQKGGALSSAAGFMLGEELMKPVLILSLPKQCLPSLQMSELGFPSYTSDKKVGGQWVKKKLKEYSGFTKVSEIHLDDIPLTSNEIDELESILKGGVYL